MRLRKIHLAGFKSFIDPVTIELPSDLIGIVGPNGCGKSNIIDAVRWVMGESSAKHLRGDMMADVIFNGSNSRKPVGQASVELVFDNSAGRLGERFAAYAEISVRRQVNRDGQSLYSLNGSRCRRRDITDVFLGTGLGPRSYAIIEQGTISRLIEARPEELREFLEEAAGISRYKERRRETETRIRHTEENLDRLDDLREELDSQLERLRRQAAQAERFKELKGEERRLRAEVLALRWSDLDAQARDGERAIAQQTNRVEAALAGQRGVERELEGQRARQGELTEGFNERYRGVLEAGAEVGRTEEAIQGLRDRREGLLEGLAHERASLEEACRHAAADAERLARLRDALRSDEPELERHEDLTAQARDDYERAEGSALELQRERERLNQRLEEPSRIAHGEHARLQSLGEQREALAARARRLESEQSGLGDAGPARRLAELGDRLEEAQRERTAAEERLARIQGEISATRERDADLGHDLDRARRDVQELGGRLASLEALQQAALGDASAEVSAWLTEQGLADAERLAEVVRVRGGWERALEVVLGEQLQAVMVADLDRHLEPAEALPTGALGLIRSGDAGLQAPARARAGASPLLEQLEAGPAAVRGRLEGVYSAPTLAAALALRETLTEGESVVTRGGLWLGKGWARVAPGRGAHEGVLEREQALREVREGLGVASGVRDELVAEVEALRARLVDEERRRAEAQGALSAVHERYAALRSEFSAAQAEVEGRAQRARDVAAELIEVGVAADSARRAAQAAQARLEEARARCEQLERERAELDVRRLALEEALAQARERWQALRQGAYERGLRLESTRSQIAALEEARARIDAQVGSLQERCARLEGDVAGLDGPMRDAEQRRQRELARHGELEAQLREARREVEAGDARLRELEHERLACEQVVQSERDELGRVRMAAQEVSVRRETVREQLQEQGHEVASVLENIEAGATEARWSEQLEQLDRRIARLGPINLAAIDEFESQSERKAYLDSQHADLTEALQTLQEAIRKIDQDTRARFKETYERVNGGLSDKFPRLFGGGHAYLQLTSEDLLETGITVMARPPGKRNSSIHLLSGGEKALTAVALVFAIFDLNPAPFCLLDEVDAPLDDANVGRFGDLVRQMSEQVQVLLVTHNKSTMEVVQQLIGVTMNEPGVSRLVAVDLDAAAEMAAD